MTNRKELFVTVGTTKFDSLIREVTSEAVLAALTRLGFTDVTLQIGQGNFKPVDTSTNEPHISYYRLKDSTAEDIKKADLVISHAGAGSILDALSAGKAVLVVINEELMGNHQTDLAVKLAKEGHLYYCGVATLATSLLTFDFHALQPFSSGDPQRLSEYLDRILVFV